MTPATMRNQARNSLTFAAVAMAAIVLTTTTANAAVYFDADFDGTTVADVGGGTYGTLITAANLNAGTDTGTWIVPAGQEQPHTTGIATDGGGNVTN